MKVLVTGAAGNLGSAVCEQLQNAEIDFCATDQLTRRKIPYRVAVANLLNREECYKLVEECDVLVHLANRPNEHAGTAQQVYGENCTTNINIFQAAFDLGVTKIIFASSVQAMVGNRRVSQAKQRPSCISYLPADGNLPTIAGNHYSASKEAGELLLKYYVQYRELPSGISIRFPGMSKPEWFEHMRRHTSLDNNWFDGYADECFSWLSFPDAGRLVAAIIKADLPGYRCYFPAHPSLRMGEDMCEMIRRFYPTVPLRKPVEELKGLVDISQITKDTGWVPQDDFHNA